MNTDRDPFLADALGRINPPDHGPDFWADLQDALSVTTPNELHAGDTDPLAAADDPTEITYSTHERPQQPRWRSAPFIAIAAALLLVVGIAGAIVADRDDDQGIVADESPTPSAEPDVVPPPEPASTPDDTTPDAGGTPTSESTPDAPTATPAEPSTGDAAVDLARAVDIGTSRDGALRLAAVPVTGQGGCEGLESWLLYWVGSDDTATQASETVFVNPPEHIPGPGDRVAFLSGCEETASSLVVGVEAPAGVLGTLTPIVPRGWENAFVRSAQWTDDGLLRAEASRTDALLTTTWQLTIDPDSGSLVTVDAVDGGECSASGLSNPSFAVFDGAHLYNSLAAAIQAAALRCDYDAVAALAADPFTYSFGGGTDFAGHLRDAESRGDNPMATLVRLLEVDPGVSPEDPNRVIWPAFFACESTCGMDLDELARLGYTDDDIAGFEEFGGYAGYRMSFEAVSAGEADTWNWTTFVAGD